MSELLEKGETYIEVTDGKQKMTIWVKYDGSKFSSDAADIETLLEVFNLSKLT